jgi:hypothetical protein
MYLAMVVGNKKSMTTNNAGKLLAFFITMRMWRYNAGRITQWSTSRASLEVTVPVLYRPGRCHGQLIC